MHEDTTEILNQLCNPLKFDLRRKIRSEFEARLKETEWIILIRVFYSELVNKCNKTKAN